jgi:hypothetical protein
MSEGTSPIFLLVLFGFMALCIFAMIQQREKFQEDKAAIFNKMGGTGDVLDVGSLQLHFYKEYGQLALINRESQQILELSDITAWRYKSIRSGLVIKGYDLMIETRNTQRPLVTMRSNERSSYKLDRAMAKLSAYLNHS